MSPPIKPPSLSESALRWWRDAAAIEGSFSASRRFLFVLWEFLRDSTPERRRQLYGDIDFDWEHHVDTTCATVTWRDRLLGVFHSAYQPTEAALFHEMMEALLRLPGVVPSKLTFIDLGSGKGRTLLMAAQYPFRRVIGVELLPALHEAALNNINACCSAPQQCRELQAVCQDATEFEFPRQASVIYLFNPFPEAGLKRVVANLEKSLQQHPRAVYVLYHNPLLERVLTESAVLKKVEGTHQYAIYASALEKSV